MSQNKRKKGTKVNKLKSESVIIKAPVASLKDIDLEKTEITQIKFQEKTLTEAKTVSVKKLEEVMSLKSDSVDENQATKEVIKEVTEPVKETSEKTKKSVEVKAAKKESNNVTKTTATEKKATSAKKKAVDPEEEFNSRFNSRYDELKWLYMELYNSANHLEDLKTNLKNIYLYRDENLKKIDREREKNSNWYKKNKLVGISVYADLFAGDLNELSKKLPYFKEMNVNYLHIMPVFKTPDGMSDGGFAVSDFRQVSEKLGGNEALEKLAAECRKNNINLCTDFVINHTSDQHEWAIKAKQGSAEHMAYYNFYDDYSIPAEFEKTMPKFGNFTYIQCLNKHVMTTFNCYQWDLNFKNPNVFNEVVYNLLYLANMGCNVLKIDSVQHIWKELYTDCRNLPEVHSILRMIRLIIEIVCPGVILAGDIQMDSPYNTVYFGEPNRSEFHLLYNENMMSTIWNSVASRDVRPLKDELSKLNTKVDNQCYVNYLRDYNDIKLDLNWNSLRKLKIDPFVHKKFLYEFLSGRFQNSFARGELFNFDPCSKTGSVCATTASLCGLEKALYERDDTQTDLAVERILMLYGFINSVSGIPVICSGDEIGQLNDYTYKEDQNRYSDVRNIYKARFNWNDADKRSNSETISGRIFNGIKKLEDLRIKYEIFSGDADFEILDCDDIAVLIFERKLNNEYLLSLSNFSEWNKSVSVENKGEYVDLITGKSYKSSEQINLKPYEFLWLYKKN